MKPKLKYLLVIITLVGFTLIGIQNLRSNDHKVKLQEIQLNDTSVKLKKLNQDYENLLQQKTIDGSKLKQLEDEKKQLEAQLQAKLQKQEDERLALQNKATLTAKVYAAEALPATSGNCGDNQYKQYIYMKESGCRTTAVNSIGCRGIGQACPGSKLPCGDDFACQDAWFSNYAVQRYGSWEAAYNFWINNHWW